MARLPQKAEFRCPGCGFCQLEPPQLISTYCRSCGGYYEVHPVSPGKAIPAVSVPGPGELTVFCHRCGSDHRVSPYAQNTICPSCNASIELGNITVNSATSRQIDTRGKLLIGHSGSLSSSWIVCGSAQVHGRLAGVLRSEGEVRLSTSLACACQITAPSVIIERNARATFSLPVETGHLEVRGHLTGIVHCRGIVHVRRGGRLEAEVHARSVKVEKGGALLGTCHVDGAQPDEPGKNSGSDQRRTFWPAPLCPAC